MAAVKQSGTSRSHAERAAGGRPSRTFALPTETDEEINRQAARLGLSRSQAVSLAIRLLAEDAGAEGRVASFLEADRKK